MWRSLNVHEPHYELGLRNHERLLYSLELPDACRGHEPVAGSGHGGYVDQAVRPLSAMATTLEQLMR